MDLPIPTAEVIDPEFAVKAADVSGSIWCWRKTRSSLRR